MRVAVVDTTTTDADGLHPVVNIIMADPSDPAPDGFLLIADDAGADATWRWGATQGFVAPPAPPQINRG